MSFNKPIPTPFGIVANYHKITKMEINWLDGDAYVTVSSFADEKTRQDKKVPLATTNYQFFGKDFFYKPEDNILEVTYKKLKQEPLWKDSKDV
jgi:hypothetical protein